MRTYLAALTLFALSACTMGPTNPAYLVFFTEHSAALDETSAGTIAQAAVTAKAAPASPVVVLGYTDSAGNASADVTLSQQRATAVADALKADGVDAARISIEGRGQTHEDPGQASRRVEIEIR